MSYAIVRQKKAYLYELDSQGKRAVTDEVLSGWALELRKESGQEWEMMDSDQPSGDPARLVRIRTHYGYEGLIERRAIRVSEKEELERRAKDGRTYVVIRPWVSLLDGPRVQDSCLEVLPLGAFVSVIPGSETDAFVRAVSADGREGFLPRCALMPRRDSDGYLLSPEREKEQFFLKERLPQGEEEIQAFRRDVISMAEKYLGSSYFWGGASPEGIDCSGLAHMAYMLSGVLIYRDAEIRPEYPIHPIPKEQAGPGDLIFFKGHVAIFVDRTHFLNSTAYASSYGVALESFDPGDPCYRGDLLEKITGYGSLFDSGKHSPVS